MKMKLWSNTVATVFCLALSAGSHAVIETYDFSNEEGRQRYQVLVDELRCPKCQNQNLSGSNSPIAEDLRRELHRMVEEGKDDEAIKEFMVRRYGNFVLYRPPLDHNTVILWGLPVLFGIAALLFAFLFRSRLVKISKSQALDEDEKKRLDEILDRYS